jgi:hypothetical protein
VVSRLAGSESALESERTYVTRALPRGILRGVGDALRGDLTGVSRSWAIVEGAVLTAASYAAARLHATRH